MQNRINTAKLREKEKVENGYSMESLSKKIGEQQSLWK